MQLTSCGLGNDAASWLAEALLLAPHLQKLCLSHNRIGNAGAIAISTGLRTNVTLREVDLTRNWIGNRGARALSEALMQNQVLEWVDTGLNFVFAEEFPEAASGRLNFKDAGHESTLKFRTLWLLGWCALSCCLEGRFDLALICLSLLCMRSVLPRFILGLALYLVMVHVGSAVYSPQVRLLRYDWLMSSCRRLKEMLRQASATARTMHGDLRSTQG